MSTDISVQKADPDTTLGHAQRYAGLAIDRVFARDGKPAPAPGQLPSDPPYGYERDSWRSLVRNEILPELGLPPEALNVKKIEAVRTKPFYRAIEILAAAYMAALPDEG